MAISFRFGYRRCSIRLARRLLMGVVMAGVAASASACAGQGSATGIPENSPVRLEVSSMFISIQNQAGLPLTDMRVSIVPYGIAGAFTTSFARLDSTEKRNIMLGDFRGRDGTPFSLRAVRPKAVRIEASDVAGKKYEVEYPWN